MSAPTDLKRIVETRTVRAWRPPRASSSSGGVGSRRGWSTSPPGFGKDPARSSYAASRASASRRCGGRALPLLRTRGYACSSRGARRRRCPSRWEPSRTCSIPRFAQVSDELAEPAAPRPCPPHWGSRRTPAGAPDRLTLLRALVAALRALAGDGVAPGDRRRPVARPRVGTRAVVRGTSHRRGADRRPRDPEGRCRRA